MKSVLSVLFTAFSVCFGAFSQDVPDFINTKANHIIVPPKADNAKWTKLASDIRNARQNGSRVDIMHIGDSHIQAEMGTSQLRAILQSQYGNAGRGLITAFRLAGTNQPVDYAITAEHPMDSMTRLLKRPWQITPGFTGIASSSVSSNRITYKNLKPEHQKFNLARIFTSDGERKVMFPNAVDSGMFYAFPGERVFGVYTCNTDSSGIVYSTIGNNGACFSDYLLIDGFADEVALFNPELIILSMGTNEGYSSKTDAQIADETRELIARLHKAMPEALMIMWMPMECEAKGENDVFAVKSRVRDARDIMIEVAENEGIPYWDFYEVAGGDGAASKWVDAGLMNPKDHVHLLGTGYRLQGALAAEALTELLNSF